MQIQCSLYSIGVKIMLPIEFPFSSVALGWKSGSNPWPREVMDFMTLWVQLSASKINSFCSKINTDLGCFSRFAALCDRSGRALRVEPQWNNFTTVFERTKLWDTYCWKGTNHLSWYLWEVFLCCSFLYWGCGYKIGMTLNYHEVLLMEKINRPNFNQLLQQMNTS